VDISKEAGITDNEHTMAVTSADFDNNGFADFLAIKRGDLVTENESLLYLNTGDGRFQKAKTHGILSPELGAIGLGIEVLDYNKDGKMDVILCNERGKWHLFKNGDLAKGNFVLVDLGPETAGKSTALGALITVEAGGKTQVKRSGTTGAMYSRSADRYVHFGLGTADKIDRIEIRLTDGTVYTIEKPVINSVASLSR